MENLKEKSDLQFDDLVKQLEPLIQQMKTIHDQAVVVYTPLVNDLCNRMAIKKRGGANARLAPDVCER